MPSSPSPCKDVDHPKYFSMIPTGGPNPKQTITEGFFQVAAAQNPKPQTVAIAAEDAEFSRNAAEGAEVHFEHHGIDHQPEQDADGDVDLRAPAELEPA